MKPPKQVIIMRKDLNMRRGKQIAQGSHASMKALLHGMEKIYHEGFGDKGILFSYTLTDRVESTMGKWLEGAFTKICVGVDSEAELDAIVTKARNEGMLCSVIIDNGTTEFNGIPTKTCACIGPWDSDEIDKITGHLKLL